MKLDYLFFFWIRVSLSIGVFIFELFLDYGDLDFKKEESQLSTKNRLESNINELQQEFYF